MKPQWKGYIGDQEANYIILLLGHMHADGKEAGLERLCRWYRRGFRLRNPHYIQQTLVGLLYNQSPKVRRWTLNAIALIGTRADHLEATLDAISRDRNDEDILGAGVAAIVSLTQPDQLLELLRQIDIPLEGAPLLAAAQQSDAFSGQLVKECFDPDKVDAPQLRLASVLVGLDKAPEFLVSSNHPNAAVLGALNEHEDILVAQYSIWAIFESSNLNVSHLQTPLKDVANRPANVRGWIYQLFTASPGEAERNRELVTVGARDGSDRARLGMATGLRRSYFPGLEEVTLDWLGQESSEEIRAEILDHMATNSERCSGYHDTVVNFYKSLGSGAVARARLEAAAQETPLYADLKRIALQNESMSLFGDAELPKGGTVIMNQINATNLNLGVLAGRDASVTGGVNVSQNVHEAANIALSELEKLLVSSSEAGVAEGMKLVQEAKGSPDRSRLAKVLEWMKGIKEAGGYIVAGSGAFMQIYQGLEQIIPQLPHL